MSQTATSTAALFTRQGEPYTGRTQQDEKGRLGFTRPRICGRCGGAGGSDKWAHTGWTCYDCDGAKVRGTEFVPVYTRERLDTLIAAQAKRDAKKAAVYAAKAAEAKREADARRDAFEQQHGALLAAAEPYLADPFVCDVVRKARQFAALTDAQAAALQSTIARAIARDTARAASEHVGQTGDRITATVTVERVYQFERRAYMSFGNEIVNIVSMRDEHGNMLVSKSARFYSEKGKRLTIKATVKSHDDYKGEKQTTINRIKVITGDEHGPGAGRRQYEAEC